MVAEMKTLLSLSEHYGERIKLISLLRRRDTEYEYPEQFKWVHQLLYLEGGLWIEICRIDNYPHAGRAEPHIHEYGKDRVRFVKLDFDRALDEIFRIGTRVLLERFRVVMRL
jgi:hypothetical protein